MPDNDSGAVLKRWNDVTKEWEFVSNIKPVTTITKHNPLDDLDFQYYYYWNNEEGDAD